MTIITTEVRCKTLALEHLLKHAHYRYSYKFEIKIKKICRYLNPGDLKLLQHDLQVFILMRIYITDQYFLLLLKLFA